MKRKIYLIAILALILLTSVFCLFACKEPEHIHVYDKQVVSSEYLKEIGTCVDKAVYYKSCECGEAGVDVFEGETTQHTYESGACLVCGESKVLNLLEYKLINNNTEYEVSNHNNCEEKVVLIPEEYNGKPVTQIGKSAFKHNFSVEEIIIPSSIKVIEVEAFDCCYNLYKVRIKEGLTEIKERAFFECNSLELINLPDSLRTVEAAIFSKCYNLVDIIIPDGITNLSPSAFSNSGIYSHVTEGSLSYIGTEENPFLILRVGEFDDSVETVKINDNCKYIEGGVFANWSKLKSITFPEGIINIDTSSLFRRCKSLTNITLPSSIKEIGRGMFLDCENLQEIIIPEQVSVIEQDAFSNCRKLKSITIPKSVKQIKAHAFDCCYDLQTIKFTGTIEEWKAIEKEARWTDVYSKKVVCRNGYTDFS